ncbi:hypothetical protein [Clavibacter tessellarius]|uniref:hypothetical protein n=1 Tax=Clavibacter tessellarius TaxID=31965 RepID=UPI003244310D
MTVLRIAARVGSADAVPLAEALEGGIPDDLREARTRRRRRAVGGAPPRRRVGARRRRPPRAGRRRDGRVRAGRGVDARDGRRAARPPRARARRGPPTVGRVDDEPGPAVPRARLGRARPRGRPGGLAPRERRAPAQRRQQPRRRLDGGRPGVRVPNALPAEPGRPPGRPGTT